MKNKYYLHGNNFEDFIKRKTPPGVYIYNGTWVHDTSFGINMQDAYVQELHRNQKLPFLIEHFKAWCICLVFFTVMMLFNIWYELIIPYFERTMDESTPEFMRIDDLVYYCQFVFPLFLVILFLIAKAKADKIKYEWAKETVNHYETIRLQDNEAFKKAILKYEVTCPNCGAPNGGDLTICEYCKSEMRLN